jgi:hypothetical protein
MSLEEHMLLQEVLPSEFATQFSAFLAKLRDSPRLLTPGAIHNITDQYPVLRVLALQQRDLPPLGATEHEWHMRYVTMPQVEGSSTNIAVKFVIDTGAIVNCMSVEYYKTYSKLLTKAGARAVQPVSNAATDIVAVDSSPLSLQTIVLDVPFILGGRKFISHFLLIASLSSTPFLLGGPWLKVARCDILYSSNALVLPASESLKRTEIAFVQRDERILRRGSLLSETL